MGYISAGTESETSSLEGFLALGTRTGGAETEKVRITSAGNVGIGTATPSFKLHVPSGYIGTDYINTTDNAVGFGVTGIMVKAGDNYHRTGNAASVLAFLGVTAPTGDNLGNHTATTTLNMNNNYITGASKYQLGAVDVIYGSPTDVYVNNRVIQNISTALQDGMYINYNSTGGAAATLRFYANGTTERMRIDAATGNVGIATGSPGQKLEVNGSVNVQNTLYFNANSGWNVGLTGAGPYTARDVGNATIASRYSLYTDQNLRMSSFAPSNFENVVGDNPAPYGIAISDGDEHAGIMGMRDGSGVNHVSYVGNNGAGQFQWRRWTWDGSNNHLGAPMMVLNWAGRLGLGHASPNTIFDVSGNGGSDGLTITQQLDNTHTIQTYIDGQYANRTTYAGGCCNALLLQPDVGVVGIGTTSPAQRLDVNGEINSSTGYRIANTAAAGNYLRGNGNTFVSSAIQAGDLPSHTHAWSQVTSKPAAWLDAANLIQDLPNFNNSVPSGFYQGYNSTNSPTASTWYNLINVRHSNTANDHGFQIAASYYDENIWTRTYQGGTGANNGTFTSWRKLISSADLSGTTNYISKFISANALGNSSIYDNGNVGIGTTSPGFKLHVPSGYIGTDYINTTDNAVGSGVTGIMVKQGDNYHRTSNAAGVLAFLGVTAPTGDNLGNHTATTTLNMNGNFINTIGRLTLSGIGGNSGVAGNDYAVYQEAGAWVHPYPDMVIQFHTGIKYSGYYGYDGHRFYTGHDGSGNPSGLAFQIGTTSNTNVSYTNFYAPVIYDNNNAGYYLDMDNGSNFNYATANDWYANNWFRVNGGGGIYWQAYGGGWYMQDGTWIRGYNGKSLWMGSGLIGGDGGLTIGYGGAGAPAGGAIIAGNVGIGTSAPSANLTVYNTTGPSAAIISAGTSFYNDWPVNWGGGLATWDICGASTYFSQYLTRSDERLKNNIIGLTDEALQTVLKLRPVSYYLNDTLESDKRKKLHFGFIAQEVQKILPNLVVSNTKGMLGMNYMEIIPILTQSIQEQQKMIDSQKKSTEAQQKASAEQQRIIQNLQSENQSLKSTVLDLKQENQTLKSDIEQIKLKLGIEDKK